jgi:hypothetical protein
MDIPGSGASFQKGEPQKHPVDPSKFERDAHVQACTAEAAPMHSSPLPVVPGKSVAPGTAHKARIVNFRYCPLR